MLLLYEKSEDKTWIVLTYSNTNQIFTCGAFTDRLSIEFRNYIVIIFKYSKSVEVIISVRPIPFNLACIIFQ